MKIKVKDIPIYYLNPDHYQEKRERMEQFLPTLGMKYERVDNTCDIPPLTRKMNEGLLRVLEKGMYENVYPFLVAEDDIELITKLPEEINIPEEAILIYWGINKYECGGLKPSLCIEEYNEEYYRIKHSLATHAILVPSKESAMLYYDVVVRAINKVDFADIYLAIESGRQLFLTPKDGPYFCQIDGHTRPVTDFLWKDVLDKYLIE